MNSEREADAVRLDAFVARAAGENKSAAARLKGMREKTHKVDWGLVVARATGILVLLAGVVVAAGLCVASPQSNQPVFRTFDSHTPCELEVRR